MGYTNKTSHYDLPQWIAGDKPSWLGDVNTAMLNIDTAIAGADASATAAESSAAAANAQVQAQEAKITKNTTDIQALTEQLADVSGVASAALPKNGGTMTGALTLAGAPTQDLQAATKKYVDDNAGFSYAHFLCAIKSEQENAVLTAEVLGTILIGSISGNLTSIAANTIMFTTTGNPLNLTPNQVYKAGYVYQASASYQLNLMYNGEVTTIKSHLTIPTGSSIWAFCGVPLA